MEEILNELRTRVALVLEYRGEVVLDDRLAKILEEVERRGSLLSACKSVGASYSRIWERISDLESLLGKRMLEVRRGGPGGGGARLTRFGKALLRIYVEERAKVRGGSRVGPLGRSLMTPPDFLLLGSHDPALDVILSEVRESAPDIELRREWLGSAGGLAALMLEYADAAGTHLLDPETGRYNVPYIPRYWLEDRVVMIRGYQREIGLVFRRGEEYGLRDILAGRAKLVNRNPGSGSRILLDYLLKRAALDEGADPAEIPKRVKGYQLEVRTHVGVARKVSSGDADVGVAIRYVAERFGLGFRRLAWEWYDLAIRRDSLRKPAAQEILKLFRSGEVGEIISAMPGYRLTPDSGRQIYP
ncbi:MAG: substrate-binding domain-containing protein [Candidatus Korarchaeota archaeon]|nr:substrate-binding domain-containing protein [Candidatus Korarchaeota archaeon]